MRSEPCAFLSLFSLFAFILPTLMSLKDSNAAAHSVVIDIFYVAINVSARSKCVRT